MAKTPLEDVINLDGTAVHVGAIRTVGTSGSATACAAHISIDYAFKAPVTGQAKAKMLYQLSAWTSLDVHYQAQLTDDRNQVYVTMKAD